MLDFEHILCFLVGIELMESRVFQILQESFGRTISTDETILLMFLMSSRMGVMLQCSNNDPLACYCHNEPTQPINKYTSYLHNLSSNHTPENE